MEEIWKDIEKHEGSYQVSTLGRVRSLDRYVTYKDGRVYFYNGITLKLIPDKDGYLSVPLGTANVKKVHRLVANAFIDNIDKKPEVNHKNGDKTDNRVCNLEWMTSSDNKYHAYKNGLRIPSKDGKYKTGKEHYNCKTLIVYDENHVEIKRYSPIKDAEKDGYRLGAMHKQMKKGRLYKGLIFKRVKV